MAPRVRAEAMSTLKRIAKSSSMRLRPRLQLVEAVEVEDDRPEDGHEGQEQQVAREVGDALGDRAGRQPTGSAWKRRT